MAPQGTPLTFLDDSSAPTGDLVDGSVVVIGNFDGVHRGHQAVLAQAVDEAAGLGLPATVMTFDPHPAEVLGRGAPPLLTPVSRRAELIARFGITRVFARKFDREFAAWTPERFVRDLLARALNARLVVVGENFRFGARRSGDLVTLRELGRSHGFLVYVHVIASDARGPFSSTRARDAISEGDVAEAEHVLGRWHAFEGEVSHGDKRGRTLGFPTANLEQIPEMLPSDGVYAVLVDELDDGRARALAPGVMNIGVRPTLARGPVRTVEVFLFDTSRDLYGARLRVHLVRRLRAERRFESLDALRKQIDEDVRAARLAVEGIAPRAQTGGAYA